VAIDSYILDEFRKESMGIIKELSEIVDKLEVPQADFPAQLMSDFAQRIDRIMGAAKTLSMEDPAHLGFLRIGQLAELCKVIGYRAANVGTRSMVPLFAAFFADVVEIISKMFTTLEDGEKCAALAKPFSEVLQKRLEWLVTKLNDATKGGAQEEKALNAEELLKSLGF
jgi:hypothetical protein